MHAHVAMIKAATCHLNESVKKALRRGGLVLLALSDLALFAMLSYHRPSNATFVSFGLNSDLHQAILQFAM